MDEARSHRTEAVFVLLALVLALAPACDKGGEGEGEGTPTAEGEEASPPDGPSAPEAAPQTPRQLGEAIGRVYIDAMLELKALVEPRPPAEELAPQLATVYERWVQVLVPMGYQREAMTASDRSAVDSGLMSVMWGQSEGELGGLQWLTDAANHYRPIDNDLANRISDFNVITQYAAFELLRRQKPEEAARLGIPPAPAEGTGP